MTVGGTLLLIQIMTQCFIFVFQEPEQHTGRDKSGTKSSGTPLYFVFLNELVGYMVTAFLTIMDYLWI